MTLDLKKDITFSGRRGCQRVATCEIVDEGLSEIGLKL